LRDDTIICLSASGATAAVSRAGAELQSWRVEGCELIWQGDPAHWSQRAPVLFPVIGESAGGQVQIEGRPYPMPRHGFAREMAFGLVERSEAAARFRLIASAVTRAHYPFDFALDVIAELGPDRLQMTFEVTNDDAREMPYAIGFHPAFPWPLCDRRREGYVIEFEAQEFPEVPNITPEGLMQATTRRLPFDGRRLLLEPALFESGALVLRNARSRSLRFVSPTGAALEYSADRFPHFAVWTKPSAPFICIEAWTGEPDLAGFQGDLLDRRSIRLLARGATARNSVEMRWRT
jgi:galactose mutarotase-like enzyme